MPGAPCLISSGWWAGNGCPAGKAYREAICAAISSSQARMACSVLSRSLSSSQPRRSGWKAPYPVRSSRGASARPRRQGPSARPRQITLFPFPARAPHRCTGRSRGCKPRVRTHRPRQSQPTARALFCSAVPATAQNPRRAAGRPAPRNPLRRRAPARSHTSA